jgi:hypothetical protein
MYIGNDLQIAHPSYKIIDDISSGFNGSTTSFALQVSGATPVPFPISTQQVMISVNGVVQEPDPTGSAGFKLLGSNIVFSSAPANGHAFFGVINAGADYVTAGSEFPDGSATAPSFTFQDDQDTGWFRNASGDVGYSSNGAAILNFDGNGLTIAAGKGLTVDTSTLKVDAANNRVGIGLTAPATNFHVKAASPILRLEDSTDPQGTNGSIGKIEFYGNDGSSGGVDVRSYIQTISTNSIGNAHALVIGLGEANAAPAEKIRILGDGKVGIGTTDPQFKVDVNGELASKNASKEFIGLQLTNNEAKIRSSFYSGASGAYRPITFYTSDSERMRIESAGNVGIGTSTPQVALEIKGINDGGNLDLLTLRNHGGDGSNVALNFISSTDQTNTAARSYIKSLRSGSGSNLAFATGNIERLRIGSGGHITTQGLTGTSFNNDSASAKILEVTGDGTVGEYGVINISGNQNTNNTGVGTLRFVNRENSASSSASSANSKQLASIQSYISTSDTNAGDDCGGFLTFAVKAEGAGIAEKLRITSTGLGIGGVASPDCALEIQGATDPKLKLESQEAGNKRLELWIDGGAAVGYIAANQSASSLQFQTTNTTALTISSTQNATFAGTVSDSKGNLRSTNFVSSSSQYTLASSNAGDTIQCSSGGWLINNATGFSAGDMVTFINNSGSDQTIATSNVTLYNTADGSTGNRTLAARGMATAICSASNTYYISGAGLS